VTLVNRCNKGTCSKNFKNISVIMRGRAESKGRILCAGVLLRLLAWEKELRKALGRQKPLGQPDSTHPLKNYHGGGYRRMDGPVKIHFDWELWKTKL